MGPNHLLRDLAYKEVYGDFFNIDTLTEEQKKAAMKHEFTQTFPVVAGILLHFITFGIFTLIHCGIMHDKMPRIKYDDFGSGRAIGFRFIPFFNYYWIFVLWRRLTQRVNFQYKLRGQHPPVSLGLTTAFCIIRIIPYYIGFIGLLIFLPIVYGQIQSAVNQLVIENDPYRMYTIN